MEEAKQLFQPVKVIVISELTIRDKELYYLMMIQNNSKFHKTEDGRFVTDIRLLAPSIKKSDFDIKKKDTSNYSIIFQNRLAKLKSDGFITVLFIIDNKEKFVYSDFPRFISLIANNGDVLKPKQRPLAWCMRIIEDIYDYRFSHEKHDVEREEESSSFDLMLLIFPIFVVRRLGTNCGLKSIVDQTCVDLLYNAHTFRKECLELEVFSRFLQEFYDHDDLLFFLYVRSIIAKVMRISFKLRWTKNNGPGNHMKPLWLSYREASHVAKIVFGSDNEDVYRDFMRLIIPQMLGERTNSGDNRHIEVTSFLHLSVVGYHQSQNQSMQDEFGNPQQRMLIPIPGQSIPTVPVPIPEGFISSVPLPLDHDYTNNNTMNEEEYYAYKQEQQDEELLQQRQYDEEQYQYESKDSYHHHQLESEYYDDNRDLDNENHYRHEEEEEYNPDLYNNYNANNNNNNELMDDHGQNIHNGTDYYGFQNITASPIYDVNNTITNYDLPHNNSSHPTPILSKAAVSSYHPLEEVEVKQDDESVVPYEKVEDLSTARILPQIASTPVIALKINYSLDKKETNTGNKHATTTTASINTNNTNKQQEDNEEVQVKQEEVEAHQKNKQQVDNDNDRHYQLLLQQEELLLQQQQQEQQTKKHNKDVIKQDKHVLFDEQQQHYQPRHDDNNNDDEAPYDPANECEMLLAHRQQEFLFALIEPLEQAQIPNDYMEYITLDLSDRINQTIEIYLSEKPINDDLEALDSYLREFLELDAFREDMESLRDEIVEYYMSDDVNQTKQ